MTEQLEFADKLIELRKQKGWSQENLADFLNVSRQAVSKWEAGRAMPDIPKLVAVADLFGVSLDELLRDRESRPEASDGPLTVGPLVAARSLLHYEYKSKAKLFGIPLVHVHHRRYGFGGPLAVAKGIIAIGDVAVGVLALGGIAVGGLAFGGLALGLLFVLGGIAVGGVAFGGLAVGVLAMGGVAVGMCSMGGLAIGAQAAGGGLAIAPVAVGGGASGEYAFADGALPPAWDVFFAEAKRHAPHAPQWFLRLIHKIGMM